MLACSDHESRMTSREVVNEFSKRHRMPDFRYDLKPGLLPMEQIELLNTCGATIIVVIAGSEDSAQWIKKIRANLPSVQIFGSHTCGRSSFLQLAGREAEEVRFPDVWQPDPHNSQTVNFLKRFEAAHGRLPDYAEACVYDAASLLTQALCKAGPSRIRVREMLHQLSPWHGVSGTVEFDGTGQNRVSNIKMSIIKNGAILPYNIPTSKKS